MEKTWMNIQKRETEGKTDMRVNDVGFRIILIPFFGITIPIVTGMINEENFTNWEVKLSFLFTILIAFIIWQGNKYLHSSLRSYFDWINKPVQKITVLLLGIVFYTVPISVLLLVGWYRLFSGQPVDWNVVTQATLIILVAVTIITHVYETAFLVRESESEMIRNEQLERAKAEAELEALKNQIDPHFIFNSLNTLSHLIEDHPLRARQFNDTLADVYRYILQNKARDLVLLRDEMEFLKSYFLLLQIRFEKGVDLVIDVPEPMLDQFVLPPISLQVLCENAIKHNEFSARAPMVLNVSMQDDKLIVWNTIRKKNANKPSSKIGLQNLRERYRLTTNLEISISESGNAFKVNLPILKLN